MYCGSNKTAMGSQRHIAEAMMRLMQEKPFSQISVSELCREAGISRQTFYTLFSSRENVMIFTLQAQCCDMREDGEAHREAACKHDRLQTLCGGYSRYLVSNRDLIRKLVENQLDYLLYDSFFEALNSADCLFSEADPALRRYAAGFYAGGVSRVARQYALEGCYASDSQLEQLLMQLFTGALFRT